MIDREDARPDDEPVPAPAAGDDGSTVESVAVELPGETPAAVPAPATEPPAVPLTIHEPSPRQTPPAPASNPIVDVSAAPSSTPSFDGHAPEPAMSPVGEIAAERPELLVGAAFAAGILAAMILRRLGN